MKNPNSARVVRPLFVLSAILFALIATSNAAERVPKAHKLQVQDPAVAARIVADGGRLLADYGSYQLYETDVLEPTLLKNATTESRDAIKKDHQVIPADAGAIGTNIEAIRLYKPAIASDWPEITIYVQEIAADREKIAANRPEMPANIEETGLNGLEAAKRGLAAGENP